MKEPLTPPQLPARTMLERLQEVRPKATLIDLEQVLRAQRKRDKRRKCAAAVRYLDHAIAAVHSEQAMIQARRAALPRLQPWHEHYKGGTRR